MNTTTDSTQATTTDETTTSAATNASTSGAGSLLQVNPADVVVATNVRLDPRLDKAFVASIRERGVLVPIVGTYDDQDRFCVLYGQRRTLAAVEAGRDLIPAYVVATPGEADRLVDQMAENDHRAALTTGERARAFEQLAALGLSAGQIAKRTATKRAEVDTALTIAGSEMASAAVDRYEFLTLDQACVIAEFDTDPEAVKALTVAAKEGQFDHVTQRLRDMREEACLLAEAKAAVEADGVAFIDAYDPWSQHATAESLDNLTDDPKKRTAITAQDHAQCPGHAAYARVGEQWQDDDNGKSVRVRTVRVTYVCLAPKKHGHHDRYGSTSGAPKAADMTDAQREKAKAERRDVIESNKAWDAAEQVRRAWVTTFLTRKTAPKGTTALVAHALTGDWTTRADVAHVNAAELSRAFGVETTTAAIDHATDGRALVLALGRVLAAYEAQTGRQSWRSVSKHTALYLGFLAANGYDLADVEKRAAGITPTRTTKTAAAKTTSK